MTEIADTPVTGDEEFDLFDALSNHRRRRIFELVHKDDIQTIGDLTDQIASEENGLPVNQLSGDQRKRVYIGLYQAHLPKLDRADYVDWDKPRGTITPRDWTKDLIPHIRELRCLDETRDTAPETDVESESGGLLTRGLAKVISR